MDVIDLTRQLVALPSINPRSQPGCDENTGELAMADRVQETLSAMGAGMLTRWEPFAGRPCVTGYFDFGANETLIFDAHMDTVPTEGMIVDPFGGEIKDGRIYGRGTCDVKGPMAAMLCALESIQSADAPRYNVLFAAVCDEEAGFGGVASFVDRLDVSIYPTVAGVIVAEPTLLNPVTAHKGTSRWAISTAGVAAHSSTPHLGRNAIYAMAPVIQALEKYAASLSQRPAHPRLGTATLSVGIIQGGMATNVIPDHCEIQVDRRLIPGENIATATAELSEALKDFDITISSPRVSAAPMETDNASELVSIVLKSAKAAGASPEPEAANYCTDGSFYGDLGVPVIVFGPGSIAQAHTKDEWIEMDQLANGVLAYRKIITG